MGKVWQLIAAEMDARKMTKADLARIAGISPAAVQKWEQGGRISLEPGIRIARELGIDIGKIRPGSEDPAAWHSRAGMKSVRETPALYGCRYPADCDLVRELADLRTGMAEMKLQMQTVVGLLGAALGDGLSADKKRVG